MAQYLKKQLYFFQNLIIRMKTHFLYSFFILLPLFTLAQSYPVSYADDQKKYYIDAVTFSGISNLDTDNDGHSGNQAYSNYTSLSPALVIKGKSYSLSVDIQDENSSYYLRVWIDWDHDFSFESTEIYFTSFDNVGKGIKTESILIPTTATAGETRMRVSVLKNVTPTANYTSGTTDGEVEDYTINIAEVEDCFYYTSDDGDERYIIDVNTGNSKYIAENTAVDIECLALWPIQGYSNLYVADAGKLGTVGIDGGAFVSIGEIDNGAYANGSDGSQSLNDVDGLAFDPRTGKLWASNRRSNAGDYDLLFQIDPVTGHFVPNAFGSGIDYVVIDGSGVYEDFDDIAVSPVNGKVYGVSYNTTNTYQLLEINPLTGGVVIATAISGAVDLEGLSFSNDGVLYATSGTQDEIYSINIATGAATYLYDILGGDVEGLTALVREANKITGTIWEDTDIDGIKDAGETTNLANVRVQLWEDVNNNNVYDVSDNLLQTYTTSSTGTYSFDFATTGNLVVTVDQSSLPTGYSLTTNTSLPIDFTTYGNTSTNNNFGAIGGIDCDSDGIPDFVEGTNDTDGDGVQNECDLDSDNDGITDAEETTNDKDGDGIANYLDLDSDNDGIPDAIEANAGVAPSGYSSASARITGSDSDGDGLLNSVDAGISSNLSRRDSDGDGLKDFNDLDSDNDGILDLVEAGGTDTNGDGRVDSFTDANANGFHDTYQSSPLSIANSDSDTEPENLPNYIDIDSDGDLIDDSREGLSPEDYRTPSIILDSDNDGILNEWDLNAGGESINPHDYENDGIPDYKDLDSDNDSGSDLIEGNDANGDGVADSSPSGVDDNDNGLDDAFDPSCSGISSFNGTATSRNEELYSTGDSYTSSSDLELVYSADDGGRQVVGIRFSNVNVPNGTIITNAYIQFTADETSSGTCLINISGEDVDNAANVVNGNGVYDISGRTNTSASVNWSPADWVAVGAAGNAQKTSELKTIVQEIVNRGGWTSGNAMMFIFDGTSSNKRVAEVNPVLTIVTADGLKYDCGSNIALQDFDGNSKLDFRDIEQILPVKLVSFDADLLEDNTVHIQWKTASEINNDYFEVQKRIDNDFVALGRMDGANNSNVLIHYHSYDLNPIEGVNYYRLKQVDFDGKISYSNIVSVDNSLESSTIIYPNPSNGEFSFVSNDDVEVVIYNSMGQEVYRNYFYADIVNLIDIQKNPKGIYFLSYKCSADRAEIKKLIVR